MNNKGHSSMSLLQILALICAAILYCVLYPFIWLGKVTGYDWWEKLIPKKQEEADHE
jgi:hypothetical protein